MTLGHLGAEFPNNLTFSSFSESHCNRAISRRRKGEGGHRGGVAPAGRGAKVSREQPSVQNDMNSREGAQGPVVKRRTARLEGAESWHGRGNPDQSVRVYCGSEGTPGVSRFLEQKRILFSKSCNR